MSASQTHTARPLADEKVRFRMSPLGQSLSGVTDPSTALQLLNLKKKQYEDIQNQANWAQHQRMLQLFDQLVEEKSRYERMPTVRRSLRERRKAVSRLEKKEESPGVVLPIVGFWRTLKGEAMRPETREGAVMATVGQKTFLIGGASRSIFNDVWVLYSLNPIWTRAQLPGPEPEPRMGHSAVVYQGQVVVFGGVTAYNRGAQVRECLNTVKCLRVDTMEWKFVHTSGLSIPMRRYHSATIVGNHMLIYGGLTEKNNFLSDMFILNLLSNKWKTVEIHGPSPGHLAFHTAVAIYPGFKTEEFKLFSGHQGTDNTGKGCPSVKTPGVYFFGGMDANSKLRNTLYVLQTGQRPLAWTTPAVSGTPPAPRFQHSFCVCPELNAALLFGGRDNTAVNGGYSCFNDIHLLDLATLTWSEVKVQGEVPVTRCSHASTVVGLQLILFGGVDGGKYCNSDTFVLELDQKVVLECVRERDRQIKRANDLKKYQERETMRVTARSSTRSRSMALVNGSLSRSRNGDSSLI